MEKSKYQEISQKLWQAQKIQLEIKPKKQQIETQKSRVAADLSNLNEVLSCSDEEIQSELLAIESSSRRLGWAFFVMGSSLMDIESKRNELNDLQVKINQIEREYDTIRRDIISKQTTYTFKLESIGKSIGSVITFASLDSRPFL